MAQIQKLFIILSVVALLNAFTSLYEFWPAKHLNQKSETEKITWTWKETIWIIIMFIAFVVFVLCFIWFNGIFPDKVRIWISSIFAVSYFMKYASSIIPSAEIIGSIVRNDSSGKLNINEHLAIFTLAITIGILNSFHVTDKIYEFVTSLPNHVFGDWMIIAFYFFVIAICTFLISSLAVSPIQFLFGFLQKKATVIPLSKIKKMESNVKRIINGHFKMETLASKLIDFGQTRQKITMLLLWCVVPFALVCDILYAVLQFALEFPASIIWYCFLFTKHVLSLVSKFGQWIVSLPNKAIVAFSFRISIIWGIVYTVAINRYSPIVFFKEESTALLEFISSTIVIPIIIEWVLSAKKEK